MSWVITNINRTTTGKSSITDIDTFNLEFSKVSEQISLEIFIDGYIIPRQSIFEEFKSINCYIHFLCLKKPNNVIPTISIAIRAAKYPYCHPSSGMFWKFIP